ncbi:MULTISPECIES: DNA phosphorothioation-associated DGQHR protein 1 [Leeuwenhoekiella]|uniref:DNA phosphorothioation-associated DGQHR protein 1 n=1 Tax=Leeuwenhoekiella TaxID=283735 RepID=UPI002352929A|nr:DNA phosphorothioation-associated DGQHR protein 1 [Leeuwenhoekiella blandensis]
MSYLKLKAFKIDQPLASFFVTKIKAEDLLEISFSEELQYVNDSGELKGNQRKQDEKRLKSIARYIDSVEMSFPNSIILAVNYNRDTGEIIEDEEKRWSVREIENDLYEINVPSKEKLASVIDGQHRLNAFQYISKKDRKNLDLVCAIFFDLTNSYQAFLFATINGNQKKVDKSLALEQFGFNIEEEPKESWTPEKFAVYYCRILNFKDSAFKGKVKLAPIYQEEIFSSINRDNFIVSTATVVDGILSLISSNPKRDRVEMGQTSIFRGRNRKALKEFRDSSPLRDAFIQNKDDLIYNIVKKYFYWVDELIWKKIGAENSYIIKTVGIQALFDLLKKILQSNPDVNNIDFKKYVENFSKVDFSDNYFQASGVGKSRIKKILFIANNFSSTSDLKDIDATNVSRILASAGD